MHVVWLARRYVEHQHLPTIELRKDVLLSTVAKIRVKLDNATYPVIPVVFDRDPPRHNNVEPEQADP